MKKIALLLVLVLLLSPLNAWGYSLPDAERIEELLKAGQYDAAATAYLAFWNLNNLTKEEKTDKIEKNIFKTAESLLKAGQYDEAITLLGVIPTYKDFDKKIAKLEKKLYSAGIALMNEGNYFKAARAFALSWDYADSKIQHQKIINAIQRSISANKGYIVAINSDGKIETSNLVQIQNDIFANWTDIISVAPYYDGSHNDLTFVVGLKKDGTVVVSPYSTPSGKQMASPALKANQNATKWLTQWTDIIAIEYTSNRWTGLKADGTVVTAGQTTLRNVNKEAEKIKVDEWNDVVAISSAAQHTVALKSNGTVVTTGSNKYNQCNVKSWENIVSIAADGYFTVGLRADGKVNITGRAFDGDATQTIKNEVFSWSNIVYVDIDSDRVVGIKEDGTVVMVDENGKRNLNLFDIVMVVPTEEYILGIKSDGTFVTIKGTPPEIKNWSLNVELEPVLPTVNLQQSN